MTHCPHKFRWQLPPHMCATGHQQRCPPLCARLYCRGRVRTDAAWTRGAPLDNMIAIRAGASAPAPTPAPSLRPAATRRPQRRSPSGSLCNVGMSLVARRVARQPCIRARFCAVRHRPTTTSWLMISIVGHRAGPKAWHCVCTCSNNTCNHTWMDLGSEHVARAASAHNAQCFGIVLRATAATLPHEFECKAASRTIWPQSMGPNNSKL